MLERCIVACSGVGHVELNPALVPGLELPEKWHLEDKHSAICIREPKLGAHSFVAQTRAVGDVWRGVPVRDYLCTATLAGRNGVAAAKAPCFKLCLLWTQAK